VLACCEFTIIAESSKIDGSCIIINMFFIHKFSTQRKETNVKGSIPIEEVKMSKSLSGGNYLLKINGMNNTASFTNKIVVQ